MNEICLPMPRFEGTNTAEVAVKIGGKQQKFNFRVESFPWTVPETSDSSENIRFRNFKSQVEGYDKTWELIQIYNPKATADTIQVLFRQRM